MSSNSGDSRAITVELQGGVGNQLFVLAAGLAQAGRLDVPLRLDLSRLGANTSAHVRRDFELAPVVDALEYQIEVAPAPRFALPLAARNVLNRIPNARRFREPSLDYSPSIEHVSPGTALTGYFQSPAYFTHGADTLMQQALERVAADNAIAPSSEVFMHIRRGDYLIAKHQNHHGLASLEYFDRAAELVRTRQPEAGFRVFTDSPEQIAPSFLNRWGATLDTQQLGLTPLQALLSLAANDGLIMSNSSFSWWAAWLSERRNPGAVFIAPRPWLASGASGHTLLPSHWITFGA